MEANVVVLGTESVGKSGEDFYCFKNVKFMFYFRLET